MAEVGVLNLTIRDNSEEAAVGLESLSKALVKVQKAVANGLNLSGVSGQLQSLSAAVSGGEKALSGIGTLLNSISTYYKSIGKLDKVKINTQPIEAIQKAVGNGIKIGNAGTQLSALRTALEGEWKTDNAYQAGMALSAIAEGAKSVQGTDLATVASNISAVAKALSEYADASEKVKDVVGVGAWSGSGGTGRSGSSLMKLNLQMFGKKSTMSEGQIGMDLDSLMKNTKSEIQSIEAIVKPLESIADKVTAINETIQTLQSSDMPSWLNEAANATNVFADSIDTMGDSAGKGLSELDLLRKKMEILTDEMNNRAAKLTQKGESPFDDKTVVNYMLQIMNINKQIEKMIDLNKQATGTSIGNEKVQQALGMDKAELMTMRYEGMIAQAAKAYDAGKLNTQQFAEAMMKIQDYGEKVLEAGGKIDAGANEATQAINALFRELNQPVDYSNLRDFVDIMTGVNTRSMPADWWGISAFENDATRQIGGIMDRLEQPIDYSNLSGVINQLQGIGAEAKSAEESMSVFLQGMQGDSPIAATIRELNPELASVAQGFSDAAEAARHYAKEANNAEDSTLSLGDAFSSLKAGMQKMFPTLSGLMKRFTSMMKMRAIRYLIRQIAAGVREGVENVYRYSQAIGSGFAPAMDSAASSLATMKNAIGAALAPALQALIPVLNSVISWFISLINVVNQFFSLLGGRATWTKAVDAQTTAFKNNEKAAKGAGGAAKDLLADWDELNIIQSQGGGGGGGGAAATAEDYANMFEEVSQYTKWIKDLVNGINDQFGNIWNLVKEIGSAILLWKFSKAFAGIVGKLAGILGTLLTIDLVFNVVTMFDNLYMQTGEPGWLVGNVLATLLGGLFTQSLLTTVLGKQAAKIGIPLIFTVSALADIVALVKNTDVSALSKEGLTLSILSALKVGGAAAYFAKVIGGKSLGKSLLLAGALTLMTFSVSVGIKAVARAVKGEDTLETIKGLALSSLSMGLGAAALAKVFGVGLAAAIAFGAVAAGATLLTLTAVIGIAALIALNKSEPVKWGNETATEEQIQNWVLGNGFDLDVPATLNLISTTVDILPEERASIENEAAKLIPTLQVIKYGIATEETYETLKTDLFGTDGEGGVIGKINKYAEEQKSMITMSFSLMPVVNAEGELDKEATKELMKAGTTGWSEVERYMSDIGGKLAEALKGSTKDGIKTFDDELILELTTKLQNVQNAISQSQISSESVGGLASGLTNVTKDTFNKTIDVWTDYQKQLKDKYNQTLQEEYSSYASLAAFYRARGNKGDEELAKYYDDKAEELLGMWQYRLEKAVDDMSAPGRTLFRDAILEMLNVNISRQDAFNAFREIGVDLNQAGALEQFIDSFFNEDGTISSYAKNKYDVFIDSMLRNVYKSDYDTVKKLIDSGAVSVADMLPEIMIDEIVSSFLGADASPEIKEALKQFLIGNFTVTDTSAVAKEAKSAAEDIRDQYLNAVENEWDASQMDRLFAELAAKYSPAEVESVIGMFKIPESDLSKVKTDAAKAEKEIESAFDWYEPLVEPFEAVSDWFRMPEVDTSEIETEATEAAKVIREKYAEAIQNGYDDSQMDELFGSLIGMYGADTVDSVLEEIGQEIDAGIKNGIDSGAADVAGSAKAMAEDTINSAKGAFGIASPSTVFEEIGEYCMQGLKNGIEKYAGEVQSVVETIANNIAETFRGAINSMGEGDMSWNIPNNMGNAFRNRTIPTTGSMIAPVMAAPQYAQGGQPVQTEQSKPVEIEDISGDVQRGVSAGNTEQNSLINQLISVCQRIAAKEFVVNINATSGLGQTVNTANGMFNTVRGPI